MQGIVREFPFLWICENYFMPEMLPDLEWGCQPGKCLDFFLCRKCSFCINFQHLVAATSFVAVFPLKSEDPVSGRKKAGIFNCAQNVFRF